MDPATSLPPFGALVLSAGGSKRLGHPKQLVHFQGKPLVVHTISALLPLTWRSIWVILGAYAEEVGRAIESLEVQKIFHPHWERGMASSISRGISEIQKRQPDLQGVVITLCDQIYLTTAHLEQIIHAHLTTQKPLVASAYGGTIGVPAFFASAFFSDLVELKGQRGARKILLDHPRQVAVVPFSGGEVDIDTEKDQERLL